jgi:hypothetical protein
MLIKRIIATKQAGPNYRLEGLYASWAKAGKIIVGEVG